MGSSPDKAGTVQYCQMGRVRRTRWEGVTKVNQWLNLRNRGTGSNLVDVGRDAVHAELGNGEATCGTVMYVGPQDREEGLRRTRGDAAGAELGTDPTDRSAVNMGTLPCLPFPVGRQPIGGQGHRRPRGTVGGGAAVVVRGRESRSHGQGRQRDRSTGSAMPGGRR